MLCSHVIPRWKTFKSEYILKSNYLASGLLKDVGNQAYMYCLNLSKRDALELLNKPRLFYEAALEDSNNHLIPISSYLSSIQNQSTNFIQSNQIYNRKVVHSVLERTIYNDHQFICLMGLKNSGKSRILQTFQQQHSDNVFYVDLRHHSNIIEGLVATVELKYQEINQKKFIQEQQREESTNALKRILNYTISYYHYWQKKLFPTSISAAQTTSAAIGAMTGSSSNMDQWSSLFSRIKGESSDSSDTIRSGNGPQTTKTQIQLLHSYVDVMRTELGTVTIIIDEANNAFQFSSSAHYPQDLQKRSNTGTQEQFLETRALFSYFITLTKQFPKVNIILSLNDDFTFPYPYPFYANSSCDSSTANEQRPDHSYVSPLPLVFDVNYFTNYVYLDELPPHEVYSLLTTEWGMKERLATMFIDHYGGNLSTIYHSLLTFKQTLQSFHSVQTADIMNIHRCLSNCSNEVQKKDLQNLLQQLSIKGYIPLPRDSYYYRNPLLLLTLTYRLGNIIQRSNQTIFDGVMGYYWEQEDAKQAVFLLVPASQALRLSILYYL